MDLLEVLDKTAWRLDLLRRKTFGGTPELKWSEIGLAIARGTFELHSLISDARIQLGEC